MITHSLYVGGRFDKGDWYILDALGVGGVVNLMAEGRDRYPHNHRPAAALWLPVIDWEGPDVITMQIGVRFIATMIAQEQPVYIHCMAGVGRAPTLAAAYLVSTGMSAGEALTFIRDKRPKINPNRGQIRMLQAFETSG